MTVSDLPPEPTVEPSVRPPEGKPKPDFFQTTAGASLILLGLALGWGLMAYYLERISLMVAVLIGMVASYSVMGVLRNPTMAKKAIMFIPSLIATLITVLLGEMVFVLLIAINEYETTLGEGITVLVQNFDIFLSDSGTAESLFFGLIGGVIGFFSAARNR